VLALDALLAIPETTQRRDGRVGAGSSSPAPWVCSLNARTATSWPSILRTRVGPAIVRLPLRELDSPHRPVELNLAKGRDGPVRLRVDAVDGNVEWTFAVSPWTAMNLVVK